MAGRIENLRPWQKGQSGNPSGRAKGPSVAKRLMRLLEEPPGQDAVIEIKADVVALAVYRAAAEGDVQATRTILAYTDGTPVQAIDVTSRDRATPLQEHLAGLNGSDPPAEGGEITQAARRLLLAGVQDQEEEKGDGD